MNLWDMINLYPKIKWNWGNISQWIDWSFIRDNPKYPWVWSRVSQNISVPWYVIEKYPELQWDKKAIAENLCVTLDIIIANKDDKRWRWSYKDLSGNPNVTLTYVKSTIIDPANRTQIWASKDVQSRTRVVPIDENEWDLKTRIVQRWDWTKLSSNPTLTWNDIYLNMNLSDGFNYHLPWDWKMISAHRSVSWISIYNNITGTDGSTIKVPWDSIYVSKNPNITIDIIRLYPHGPLNNTWIWNMEAVCSKDDLTWQMLCNSPSGLIGFDGQFIGQWHWGGFSANPNININIVINNVHIPWDWKALSCNCAILLEDIVAHCDLPWDISSLCCRKN